MCSSWCSITTPIFVSFPRSPPKLSVITVIGPINRLARAAPPAPDTSPLLPFETPALCLPSLFSLALAFSHFLSLSLSLCFSLRCSSLSHSLYNDAHLRQRVPTPTRSTRWLAKLTGDMAEGNRPALLRYIRVRVRLCKYISTTVLASTSSSFSPTPPSLSSPPPRSTSSFDSNSRHRRAHCSPRVLVIQKQCCAPPEIRGARCIGVSGAA